MIRQNCGSCAPHVPVESIPSKRLVIIEELGGKAYHVGWFDSASGWWFSLSDERRNGDKMPRGEWCSLDIGNVTGWREINSVHCANLHDELTDKLAYLVEYPLAMQNEGFASEVRAILAKAKGGAR